MADDRRLAIVDPSGRLIVELGPLAGRTGVALVPAASAAAAALIPNLAGLLIAPLAAPELPPPRPDSLPRWIVGDGANPSRVAGAAAQAGAAGVLLTPVSPDALDAIAQPERATPEVDLARARGLIATSLVDLTGAGDAFAGLRILPGSAAAIATLPAGIPAAPTVGRHKG